MKYISSLIVLLLMTTVSIAQRPDAPEFGQRGALTIGTHEFTVEDDERPLTAAIWYPAANNDGIDEETTYQQSVFQTDGRAIRDATPLLDDAPYPLVIFSHGNTGFRYQSIYLMEHLASHGFVVIAIDHPGNTIFDAVDEETFINAFPTTFAQRPKDITRVLDYVEGELTVEGTFSGIIDTEKVAVIGHSFGGLTALAASGLRYNFDQLSQYCSANTIMAINELCFLIDEEANIADEFGLEAVPEDGRWPSAGDDRVDAVVALAPWAGLIFDQDDVQTSDVPTLFIVGSNDSVTPPARDSLPVFETMLGASTTGYVSFQHGEHYLFANACTELIVSLGFFERCSDPVWDMERAHDLTNHFTTAFLHYVLLDNEGALATLQTDSTQFAGIDYTFVNEQVEILKPEVISVRPHDSNAYTQGLLLYEGSLYESTGQYGESSLREVNPETGEVIRQINLNEQFFGEGLARVDDRLIQITWREGAAIVFDLASFEFIEAFQYNTEGWGLCYDGEVLYMTDGSSNLYQRNPVTFEITQVINVTMRGEPVVRLNELECVGEDVYANVWQEDYIVRIDKATGKVNAYIDAIDLLTDAERAALSSGEVLNGIAYDEANDVFLITGKNWPKLFEVRFVPAEEWSSS